MLPHSNFGGGHVGTKAPAGRTGLSMPIFSQGGFQLAALQAIATAG